ncbi:MAG: hypothetical protein CM15mP47_1470 [Methanobacteriota archaeon]|nr:MAG: hypothetical protein CM15mP47_1470 [Euryarchaeota archaeon]
MLPDTIHKLSREERFSYARLLAFMARVDNELTVDEMAMFEQRLGTALLSPKQRELIRQALKTPPPLDECLAGLSEEVSEKSIENTFFDGCSGWYC